MRYIFMALHAEASLLIRQLHLKQIDGPIRCFQNEDTFLTLTGTGPLSASAVTAAVLSSHPVSDTDCILNAGTAAAVCGAEKGTVYSVHKIIDLSSRRDYYPDLIPPSCFKEAAVCTGSTLYTGSDSRLHSRRESILLYDMESAGIMHAASMFADVHQIRFLKIVTDFGSVPDQTVINEYCGVLAEAITQELSTMHEYLQAVHVHQETIDFPYDDFHASTAMRRKLLQVLKYCRLAGIDSTAVLQRYYENGTLPARDKAAGKRVMEEVIHELLP